MPATPLQEIEAKLHERFDDDPPSREEGGEFLLEQYPRMDGGISIAIALTALALQGWQVYRSERDRRLQASVAGGENKCPECKNPEIGKSDDGKSVCKNDHTW